MVFRMPGKRVLYGRLPQREGGDGLVICLRTRDPETAEAMQALLGRLRHKRRWDILDAIRDRRTTIAKVYEADQAGDVDAVLVPLSDVDLSYHVAPWLAQLRTRVTEQTADQYEAHVTRFGPHWRSQFTPETVGRYIAGLPISNLGRQNHWKAISSFAGYLVRIGVLTASPLDKVLWPRSPEPDVVWLDQPDMQRVCDAAEEPFRSLFYLIYGTGIENTVAYKLTRRAVNLQAREIFAPGTKTYNRKRVVRVSEWAWPVVERLCEGKLPAARLFPTIRNRHTPWYRHRSAVRAAGLEGYTLHDARHSWAVRAARAGTPTEIIARQLGHKDATMVLKVYGRFLPDQHDRDRWERIAAAQDAARSATDSATSGV
jgi:integrase